MPRSPNLLPAGVRVTDKVTLGLFARTYNVEAVLAALLKHDRATKRVRDLPNHVVVYFVMMLALFRDSAQGEVLRIVYEGLRALKGFDSGVKIAVSSAITQARSRVGADVLKELFHDHAKPLAQSQDKGAFFRGYRIVAIDGSKVNVADKAENAAVFGRPSGRRGEGAYPQMSTVSLVECGTHAFLRSEVGPYLDSEHKLVRKILPSFDSDMICLADRNFFGFELWSEAESTGAKLLWRARKDFTFAVLKVLSDGSYLTTIHVKSDHKRQRGKVVRVIEYVVRGSKNNESIRVVTNILSEEEAPAIELANLYHERWEFENALDELKTHLGAESATMRSYTPELVKQEWYGTLMAYYALRGVMHDAARKGGVDDDDLSFTHAVRVVRRRVPMTVDFPP